MKAPHSPAAVESTGAASTATGIRPADATLLDVLRVQGSLGVADIAAALGVTATAVRQRLERLMTAGLIDR
ncbi:MAG: Lrp/AsnC family transcriptional regulator, partial [Planctomycetia bacterium]|nr:Lrp/AsnC family transcriptional regulator [Planctomycetia bacterium]